MFVNKENVENISFKIGNKIDINNSNLRKAFSGIFGKEGSKTHVGLLAKYGWSIIENSDGSLSIDYGSRKNETVKTENTLAKVTEHEKHKKFLKSLSENAPTQKQQEELAKSFSEHTINTPTIQNTLEDK